MRFVVKRDSTKDIEVTSFEILDSKKEGFLEKWKPYALTAIAASVITGMFFLYFLPDDLNFEMHREMSIKIEKADAPKRNSAGTDGITATID